MYEHFVSPTLMFYIVLAQYLFAINGAKPSAWEQKGVAVAGYTVAVLCEFCDDYLAISQLTSV